MTELAEQPLTNLHKEKYINNADSSFTVTPSYMRSKMRFGYLNRNR